MNEITPIQIIQNPAIGAISIWHFTVEYYKARDKSTGPVLPLSFFVLPIIFHAQTRELIATRNFSGGLYKASTEDKSFGNGIVSRAEDLYDLTWQSIGIASAGNLVKYEPTSTVLTPMRLSLPDSMETDADTKSMFGAAKRLGNWFASFPIEEICLLLRVRF